jgi:cysteinyl-tRNA synthetase
MSLKFFNTLSRSVQDFVPLDPAGRNVGLYCCGPTVHDFAHIGNFRTFVFADLVRRYLEFKGLAVRHVMNVTDVEDKIIKRVRENKTTLAEYTGRFEKAFFEDFQTLGCQMPHQTPHATAFIGQIIALIEKLVARGIAYSASDGSVYFSIEKYRSAGCCYGQLLNLNFEELRQGERVSNDEYAKESIADFALWKGRVPDDGDLFWPSPWGEGRPGWHIECSAMSTQILGPSFDIHMGGEDLIFPHHEDEIAQSEGAALQAPGHPFVKYWLHGAHLLVEGRKMSKSLGNFFTLRDLLAKGFTGREIRYLLLTAHYRESFNFTLDGLQGAKTALGRLDECVARLREVAGTTVTVAEPGLVGKLEQAMDEDLNVSRAWGEVFEWVRETNRLLASNALSSQQAAGRLASWEKVNSVLGIEPARTTTMAAGAADGAAVPPEIAALLDRRQAARKARDFKQADAVRDELKKQGWVIEDTPKGARLKRV